jgi:MFS family permease
MRAGFLSVFRVRDFRLIWASSVLSDLGTWMQVGALAIFVTDTTSSSTWTGIASTVSYLSAGLLTPLGGVIADRIERRKLVLLTSLVECAIGIAIAGCFALGERSPAILVLLAGLQGMAAAVVVPALNAFVPDIVSKERAPHAALLEGVSWNTGRALGPIIAVAIVKWQSYEAVFVLNSLTFACTALAMFLVATRSRAVFEDASLSSRLHTGWNGLRHNSICLHATILATVEIALIAPFIALIPVMAQITLESSKTASGLLFLGQGIGSAVGLALMGAVMHRYGIGRSFVVLLASLPPLLIAYAWSPSVAVALIIVVPMSAAHSIVLALAIAFVTQYAADEMRGRVGALHRSITVSSYAISSSILAVVTNYSDLRTTLTATGIASGAFLLWMYFSRHRGLHMIALMDKKVRNIEEIAVETGAD